MEARSQIPFSLIHSCSRTFGRKQEGSLKHFICKGCAHIVAMHKENQKTNRQLDCAFDQQPLHQSSSFHPSDDSCHHRCMAALGGGTCPPGQQAARHQLLRPQVVDLLAHVDRQRQLHQHRLAVQADGAALLCGQKSLLPFLSFISYALEIHTKS